MAIAEMRNPTVHVIMPIWSDTGFQAKQAAIARGAAAAGFKPQFPEYVPSNPQFEPQTYMRQLESASTVLADLTGERPSCYFEMGFAEAAGRPLHIIAEAGTDIHQSAYRHRVRYYRDLEDLEQSVFEILSGEKRSEFRAVHA
jgi:nucleoside 2-deoxyribosyltransferase